MDPADRVGQILREKDYEVKIEDTPNGKMIYTRPQIDTRMRRKIEEEGFTIKRDYTAIGVYKIQKV